MDSILQSIKKLLGIAPDYIEFDIDIILHINSVFTILKQLGVGPDAGFSIIDETATWADFIPTTDENFHAVKTYIYMKTKIIFDPPQSSIAMKAMEQAISEYEWRMNSNAETSGKGVIQNGTGIV